MPPFANIVTLVAIVVFVAPAAAVHLRATDWSSSASSAQLGLTAGSESLQRGALRKATNKTTVTSTSADANQSDISRALNNEDATKAVHLATQVVDFNAVSARDTNRLDQLLAVHLDKSNYFATALGSNSRVGLAKVFHDLERSLNENMKYLRDSFQHFDSKCNESIAKSRERMAAFAQLRSFAGISQNSTTQQRVALSKSYEEKLRQEKLIHNEYVLVCHTRLVQHLQDVEQTRTDLAAVRRALQLLSSGSDAQIQAFINHEKGTASTAIAAQNRNRSTSGQTADIQRSLALQLAAAREKTAHLSSYDTGLGSDDDPRLADKEDAVKRAVNATAQFQSEVSSMEV